MSENENPPDASRPPAEERAASASPAHPGAAAEGSWERGVLERLATSALAEQRRARRWGIFFKFAFLIYLVVLLVPYVRFEGLMPSGGEKHTALVEVEGTIGAETAASADRVISGLRAAFDDDDTAGVIVRINSPGGSPVQAGYINDEIRRLRTKHPDIPLYAVITDICASGGYYIASAADKIYADKSSIVGSIGVLMNGFGFVDTMDKLGVERRLLTAGKHKGFLDPFSPLKPEEVAHLQGLLDQMHRQFIEVVKRGRGERLKGSDEELFNGYVWTGERSVGLGLVDALGTSSGVARDVIGAERIVDYTVHESIVKRVADRFGVGLAQALLDVTGATSVR